MIDGSRKNYVLILNGLYRSWADHIAKEMDAYIYYIIDKDFTLGGTCDIAIETIEKYADTGDGVDWFLIDLSRSKSKLNLHSYPNHSWQN